MLKPHRSYVLPGAVFVVLSVLNACATTTPASPTPARPSVWDLAQATVVVFASEAYDILGDSTATATSQIARPRNEGNVKRPGPRVRDRPVRLYVTQTPVGRDIVGAIPASTNPASLATSSPTPARIAVPSEAQTATPTPEARTPVAYHSLGVRPDGAMRLTDPPPGASDQNPAFSPDGSRLVFTRFERGYNDGPAGLFLLDILSGITSRITPYEDQDNVNLPGSSWDAAGNRIVFSSDRDDADDLWSVSSDASGLVRITEHEGPPMYYEPSWSPDGEWVVFEARSSGSGEDGQAGEIWKVRADGSELTQLTEGYDDRQPNWSHTLDRVLFQRRGRVEPDWEIYTMTPDGEDIRPATTSPLSDTDASWSTDGEWIVYSADHGALPSPNIFVLPREGGTPIRVTRGDGNEDAAPSWSPDGLWIAFESHNFEDEESPAALWIIAAPRLSDP
ncbi:MAG: PD40 domain-containing protein [Chloroflexi bacterium]|nr:PD40 domain-containing protein [Chloroflexota bacterium]